MVMANRFDRNTSEVIYACPNCGARNECTIHDALSEQQKCSCCGSISAMQVEITVLEPLLIQVKNEDQE